MTRETVDLGPLMDVEVLIPEINVNRFQYPIAMTSDMWDDLQVPDIVADAISQVLGPEVPINAFMPYHYLKAGLLPSWIVVYFMALQKPRDSTSYTTVFGRAMHLIEAFREHMLSAAGALPPVYMPDPIQGHLRKDDDEDEDQAGPGGSKGKSKEKQSTTGLKYSDWRDNTGCKHQ